MFKLKFCTYCGKPFFKDRFFHNKPICNSCNNLALYLEIQVMQGLRKHLK